ncbi:unnamed protein product [Cylicocyclus nassatus]|uniref:Uncharacterized protein n=1 Tax=Cylicocyclus nassatus TaxID=53992 RepID=A0AA36H1N2_CYLNA|nr:unnamed protein product [Cylicocyclus nassatus]
MSDYNVVCTINKSEPPFEPNIYLCKENSTCCFTRGNPTCCLREVSIKHVFEQTYPIVLVFLCLLLAAVIINWYFTDEEPPADIENESVEKKSVMGLLCPSDEDETVDDPLFGKVYEENVSRKAYVARQPDRDNLRRRKSTHCTLED